MGVDTLVKAQKHVLRSLGVELKLEELDILLIEKID